MSFGLTVLGSVNLDLIVQVRELPKPGETVTGGEYTALPGGKGANVAVAAKRLGAETEIMAAVGKDDYAAQALVNLDAEGVYLDAVRRLDVHTGLAFITVSDDGENQIAVASGANAAYAPADVPKLCSDVLITQFEIPVAVIESALEGYTGFVAVNASPVRDDVDAILKRAELVIVNEGEAAQYNLSEHTGLVAVTLGSKGAELRKEGTVIAFATPPRVEVVDTTGAGDAFAAALTVALAEGKSGQTALEFACAVGALTTTKLGTQTASPTRAEVDALLGR